MVSIETIEYGDSIRIEKILLERLKIYIDEGDLAAFFWRNNFNEAQKISTKYNRCYVPTQSPSVVPTFISTSPSISKPPGAVSILFQVSLCGGKSANELSECCREQIIVSAKKSMSEIMTIVSGRKLKKIPSTHANNQSNMSNILSRKLPEYVEEAQIFCKIVSLKDDPGKLILSFFVFKLKKEHFKLNKIL